MNIETIPTPSNEASTSNQSHGWGSWISSFIWDDEENHQQNTHTNTHNQTNTHTGTNTTLSTWPAHLPVLPFTYDHQLTHLVVFDCLDNRPFTIIISDLDYQFLKYVENLEYVQVNDLALHTETDHHSPVNMSLKLFMTYFNRVIPSTAPEYAVICEVLKLKNLYDCFGAVDMGTEIIAGWFNNIFSPLDTTACILENLCQDTLVHCLHWFPTIFKNE